VMTYNRYNDRMHVPMINSSLGNDARVRGTGKEEQSG
jgi:hypothetical protein